MTKPQHLALDLYGAHLWLATDRRAWATLRRQLPSLDPKPEAQGRVDLTLHTATNGKTTPHLTIWLDVKAIDDETERIDLVAHEATHAAALLLDHIGQAYDGQSECLAYLVGYVAAWCYRGCRSLA